VTTLATRSLAERFRFSEGAQPFSVEAARGYAWRNPTATAALVLVHGLQSHAQWFAEAGELLWERGFSVYALDRRGSGSSPGVRGDIGDYRQWYAEVEAVVRLAESEQPGIGVHLVGHCFGADVALGTLLAGRVKARSLVMLTPGFYVLPDYTVIEKIRIGVSAYLAPQARFRVPQDDSLFSRDRQVVDWIAADEYGARTLTARCLMQINAMLANLRRRAGELSTPLLVLEAAHDRLSDNRRNRALLEHALAGRYSHKTFDAEHFLLAEQCRDQVIDALVQWLEDTRC